jgi:hypothetical protein
MKSRLRYLWSRAWDRVSFQNETLDGVVCVVAAWFPDSWYDQND